MLRFYQVPYDVMLTDIIGSLTRFHHESLSKLGRYFRCLVWRKTKTTVHILNTFAFILFTKINLESWIPTHSPVPFYFILLYLYTFSFSTLILFQFIRPAGCFLCRELVDFLKYIAPCPQASCRKKHPAGRMHCLIGRFKKSKVTVITKIEICSSKFLNYLAMKQKQM